MLLPFVPLSRPRSVAVVNVLPTAAAVMAWLLKLVLEVPPLAQVLGWDAAQQPLVGAPGFTVAGYAHLAGTLAGLACAMALDGATGLWRARSVNPAS